MQQIAALALAFAVFALSGVAATAQTTQPVEITADRFVIKEQQNQAEFSGNVVVTQPDLKVWADRVIVHYGSGGTSDIESFEALSNVKIQNSDQPTSSLFTHCLKSSLPKRAANTLHFLSNAASSVSESIAASCISLSNDINVPRLISPNS